jgi:hypothetical protein
LLGGLCAEREAVLATKAQDKEVEQAFALLTKGYVDLATAATAFTDVVDLCTDDGEVLTVEDALRLVGMAHVARRTAGWAVEEADKVLEALTQVYYIAEQERELEEADARKEAENAR